jgi:hypothetical protein
MIILFYIMDLDIIKYINIYYYIISLILNPIIGFIIWYTTIIIIFKCVNIYCKLLDSVSDSDSDSDIENQ